MHRYYDLQKHPDYLTMNRLLSLLLYLSGQWTPCINFPDLLDSLKAFMRS